MKVLLRSFFLITFLVLYAGVELADAQRWSLSRNTEIAPSGPVGISISVSNNPYLGMDFFLNERFSLSASAHYAGFFNEDNDAVSYRAGLRGYSAVTAGTQTYLGLQYIRDSFTDADDRDSIAPLIGFQQRMSPRFELFGELALQISLSDSFVSLDPTSVGMRYRF
ncbi:hypothetical protein CYPRO_1405 [Cyclonatronum proteinivorum]|uniref:Outer membrane protein beta-barrel domain-containing protein n=1 Tax=Cyclonatronum proteinivorum TaxID=1457365 RepID=A0A345UJK9_9BACT|nr:hypothetical protein [Cyclonatronum proteinivorum]AXJ00661.1 hypothetical protein CYPRO_1405 [Cyclonatronum proteinivorum]